MKYIISALYIGEPLQYGDFRVLERKHPEGYTSDEVIYVEIARCHSYDAAKAIVSALGNAR